MLKEHNIVQVSRLTRFYAEDVASGNLDKPIDADGASEQEVSNIIRKKRTNGSAYYLTNFSRDPLSETIWIPASEISNCKDIIRSYEDSTRHFNIKFRDFKSVHQHYFDSSYPLPLLTMNYLRGRSPY